MAFLGILSKSVNMLEINLEILLTAPIRSPKALVFKTMTSITLLHALAASSMDFYPAMLYSALRVSSIPGVSSQVDFTSLFPFLKETSIGVMQEVHEIE